MSVLISPVKSTPICRGGRVKALNRRTGCASVRNALQAWAGPTQTRGTRNLFRNRVCSRTGPEIRKFRKHLGAELGGLPVNRHTRESHIQRSFRAHCGTERQLGGDAAGPARSFRRKSTLLAVPSLLDEKKLHDEKEFLQQMRAGPLDRRFTLFVGLRCMLFHRNCLITWTMLVESWPSGATSTTTSGRTPRSKTKPRRRAPGA